MHGVGLIIFLLIGIISGSWGPAAVVGVVVGVVCFMVQEDGKDMRAYYNCRDYWLRKDRPVKEWRREARNAANERTVSVRRTVIDSPVRERTFVCPVCGRYVKSAYTQSERRGRIIAEYYCPRCRSMRTSGI